MTDADEREALARVLHADDVKHGRAFSDFALMNEYAIGWYFDNADAILAAGFRRQGPITDAQIDAALVAWYGVNARWNWIARDGMRAALEAARSTS